MGLEIRSLSKGEARFTVGCVIPYASPQANFDAAGVRANEIRQHVEALSAATRRAAKHTQVSSQPGNKTFDARPCPRNVPANESAAKATRPAPGRVKAQIPSRSF